jgi:hypothetical protein
MAMQFFVYFTVSEGGSMNPPTPDGMAKMGKFMERSFESGKIVATGQLPRQTTHVRLDKGKFSVSDGPFIEGRDLIPGFTIINVDSKEEAIAWAKELRECMGDGILKLARLSATGREDIRM